MKTILCAATVLLLMLASMMFWMGEFIGRGLVQSPVSPTRYFVAGFILTVMAGLSLRGAVENSL